MTEPPQNLPTLEGKSFRKARVYRIRFYQITSFLGAVLALGLILLLIVPKPSETCRARTPLRGANLAMGSETPRRAAAVTTAVGDPRRAEADPAGAVRPRASAVPPLLETRPRTRAMTRAALVIDDVGLDLALVKRAARLRYPITFSVLPHKRYSTESAEFLHRMGYEILLHLPMEPEEYPKVDPGEGAILVSMTASDVLRTIDGDLRSVPHADGVNNHMGSKATQIPSLMNEVFPVLKDRHLFYIDSMTHPQSVGFRLARSLRIPSCERAIFLDHEKNLAHIEEQFSKFRRMAGERDNTLAIGHLTPLTLDVIEKRLPSLGADGVRLVFASRLASLPEPTETPAVKTAENLSDRHRY